MTSIIGRFHKEEIDEKQYFVYHLDSPGQLSKESKNTDNNLFLCPSVRWDLSRLRFIELYGRLDLTHNDYMETESSFYFDNVIRKNESSDENNEKERLDFDNHHYVLPYFGFKEGDKKHHLFCGMCRYRVKTGSDYYFCVDCNHIYHKKCVEHPPEIKHPYHPNHSLKCFYTRKGENFYVYRCTMCNVKVDTFGVFDSIPFVMEKTKRHEHPLTFFTRKDHLRCNVCGLINNNHPTYVCLECDFVVYQDCAEFPSVIRISRHHHRISFTSSLPSGKWSCGVCRKNVDGDYGGYTCNKCDDYVVHSRCALRKDIWDGKELEGIHEDYDIEEVLEPFEMISDGIILHFLHDHHLKSKTSGEIYDESKICDACVLPIYGGKFYSCMECDFILHDDCANAPRMIRHPLHPHPLTLRIINGSETKGYIDCNACFRECSGFGYESISGGRPFDLDVRCASISEPFIYQGHDHPLYLALDPEERHACHICQTDNKILINCIECDFIICLKCVNLPYMAKYKHDTHFLTLTLGKETEEPDWCEVCEKLLISSIEEENMKKEDNDGEDKRFYECKQCCTTLHINCLLGKTPYIKSGHTVHMNCQVTANNSLSRPFCDRCGDRCEDKIFLRIFDGTVCSIYPCT